MKKLILFSSIAFGCGSLVVAQKSIVFDSPKPMIVKVDVADVRSEPVRAGKKYVYDEKQETQVTKGERVDVLERRGDWVRVQVPDQQEFTHKSQWEGYPGWIELRFLTNDLTLEQKPTPPTVFDNDLRAQILSEAKRHEGSSYLWGGRSVHNAKYKDALTGVDCSGLVNWSYARVGWIVPRDAHEQSMKAQQIDPSQLKPADLIFLAKTDNPQKIVHVALYKGNGVLIEAPQTGEPVREISFEKRFGKPLNELTNGATVGDRVITFGTFFPKEIENGETNGK